MLIFFLSNVGMGGGGSPTTFIALPLDPWATVAVGDTGSLALAPGRTVAAVDPGALTLAPGRTVAASIPSDLE